jgi:hypothetical protein
LAHVCTDDIFWRCTLLACDVVHRILQASNATDAEDSLLASAAFKSATPLAQKRPGFYDGDGDQLLSELVVPPANVAWDSLKRGFSVLRILIRECARAILQEPSPATSTNSSTPAARPSTPHDDESAEAAAIVRGEPFCLGGNGISMLCSFLLGPLLVLIPSVHLISTRMASRSEANRLALARQGDINHLATPVYVEFFEASRVAFGEMTEDLIAVLKELLQGLLGAQAEKFNHLGGGHAVSAPCVEFFSCNSPGGIDLEKLRLMVGNNLVCSHTKQLRHLEAVLISRIALLRDISPCTK